MTIPGRSNDPLFEPLFHRKFGAILNPGIAACKLCYKFISIILAPDAANF
jgi:hypothetical protein